MWCSTRSILGPLLFILYVNDKPSTANILDFILFADDTTILYSHESVESQISVMKAELKEVSNWFKTNSKTNYMMLGTSHMTSVKAQQHFNVILDDTVLDRVKNTKFLGVLIDETLTWKCHIDCVSKTLSSNIGIMNKLKHFIPGSIRYYILSIVLLFYLALTMAFSYGGKYVKFT